MVVTFFPSICRRETTAPDAKLTKTCQTSGVQVGVGQPGGSGLHDNTGIDGGMVGMHVFVVDRVRCRKRAPSTQRSSMASVCVEVFGDKKLETGSPLASWLRCGLTPCELAMLRTIERRLAPLPPSRRRRCPRQSEREPCCWPPAGFRCRLAPNRAFTRWCCLG